MVSCKHFSITAVDECLVVCPECGAEYQMDFAQMLLFEMIQRLNLRVDNLEMQVETLTHQPDPRNQI